MPLGTAPLVLIVEDDADTRAALVDLLEQEGYRVLTAKDGHDALAVLARGPSPSVILTDLQMPRMNGADFCRACADSPTLQHIPRIVATGLSDTLGCEGDLFVSKPLDADRLLAALERAVAGATRR